MARTKGGRTSSIVNTTLLTATGLALAVNPASAQDGMVQEAPAQQGETTAAFPGEAGEAVPASAAPAATQTKGLFAGIMDPYPYDPRGRRDPFAQLIDDKPMEEGLPHGPLLPLQQFDLNNLRLVGVLWDVKKPKAMLMDPSGHTHIVSPNAKIGPRNGYVAVIREGEIVVVETVVEGERLVSTAQVMKIAK